MIDLPRVGLILAPQFRSRAYVQYMIEQGLRPACVLAIPAPEWAWNGADVVQMTLPGRDRPFAFRPGVAAIESARNAGWRVIAMPEIDVNAPANVQLFNSLDQDVLVYSGMSKVLVAKRTLESGKRFLHCHGGYLPDFRGATGHYFGLLEAGMLGVSAIWLNEEVDGGAVVARRWYEPDRGVNVDLVQDPVVRAHLLVEVLSEAARTGSYPAVATPHDGNLHFVIHPVLKAIALQRYAA